MNAPTAADYEIRAHRDGTLLFPWTAEIYYRGNWDSLQIGQTERAAVRRASRVVRREVRVGRKVRSYDGCGVPR